MAKKEIEPRKKEKVQPKAWGIFIIVMLASVMAPLAQFKVTPLASMLVETYGFPFSTFGLLMSWMSIIGIILAFPAAFIVGKLGPKASVMVCLVSILFGTFLGAIAPNTPVLFVSRVFEGIGLGLMGIAAPSCITPWFPPGRLGFPMGIWSAWVPCGIVIAFNTAPRIAGAFGNVHAVWWAALILTAVVTVLFALAYKLPDGVSKESFIVKGTLKEEVKLSLTPNIWILGLAFFAFHTVGTVTLNTYYPSFLQETYAMNPVDSSQWTSYHTMLCILANPLGGFLFEKTRKPKILISAGLIILIVCAAVSWSTNFGVDVFFIMFSALGIGLVAGCCRAFGIELLAGKNAAMATPVSNAVLTFCQRGCDCFGPIIYSAILLNGDWTMCNWFTIPVLLLSLVLIVFALRHRGGSEVELG